MPALLRTVTSLVLLIMTAATTSAEPSIEAAILQARSLLDNGAYTEAITVLDTMPVVTVPLPKLLRFNIATIRAEALLGEAYYDDAFLIARAALEASRELGRAEIADSLLLVARAEILWTDRSAPSEVLEQALVAATEIDGPDGLRALRVKDRIALILSASGQPAEAESMMREVIAQANLLPGNPMRDKLRFLNTLGIALLRQSKFEAAREAFSSALNGRADLLSQRHPETLESQHNLGVALRRLGRRQEADAAFAKTLRLRSVILGPDHPDTLVTRTMIVRQLIDKSDFDGAAAGAGASQRQD